MENEQTNEIAQVADMKLLSNRAHEYVVNFRNRFLTYFALPLFLLFILLALLVSWTVYVPTRSEHTVTIESSGAGLSLRLSPEIQQLIDLKADKVQKAQISYITEGGSLNQLDCQVTINGDVFIEDKSADWYSGIPMNATLVLYVAEDRFIHKLLDELAKNLKIKKPPVTPENQP